MVEVKGGLYKMFPFEIKTLSDLKAYLATLENVPKEYRIALGSLIFTKDDQVILLERGDKARDAAGQLEGIGGGLDEGEEDLIGALLREIHEEIGDVTVEIDKVLTVKILR